MGVTIQENEQICFSGSQSAIDFIKSKDLQQVPLSSLTDHLLQTTKADSPFACEKHLSYPLLPTEYKGPQWTTKIGQRLLQTYMTILGFGKEGTKTYGLPSDKPSYWPDSISWEHFQHPSYCKGKDVNVILEKIFLHLELDITKHHKNSECCGPPRKKRKESKNQSDKNDLTVNEEDSDYLNSSQFSAHDDDYDNDGNNNNSNTPDFPLEDEPCAYQQIRLQAIAERNAAMEAAERNGEF